jgi:hypothetical protein
MSNEFLSAATLGLITKEAVYEWKNNNTFLATATRDYDDMYAPNAYYNPGDTIQLRLPNTFITQSGDTVTAKDVKETYASVTLESILSVPLTYTTTDLTTKVGMANWKNRILYPAARALSNTLNAKVAEKAALQVDQFVGDETADLSAYSNIDDAAVKLDIMAVDRAKRRYCSLHPKQAGKLRSASSIQNSFLPALNEEVTRQAQLGRLAGFDMLVDQSIYYQSTTKASGTITVKTNVANGATTITLTGGTGTILAGDVITLQGAYSVNPVTKQSTGEYVQVVNTVDVTFAASDAIITLARPLYYTTTDARQNISTQLLATSAVTLHASQHINLAWATDGLVVVCPKLAPLDSPYSVTMQDPDTGYSMRISKTAEVLDNANILRLDVLYGIRWLGDRACRILTK